MEKLEELSLVEMNRYEIYSINGGGWMAYTLGWIVGAMGRAGEGLERAGFNHAGANK